jgi:hypothetical protein
MALVVWETIAFQLAFITGDNCMTLISIGQAVSKGHSGRSNRFEASSAS